MHCHTYERDIGICLGIRVSQDERAIFEAEQSRTTLSDFYAPKGFEAEIEVLGRRW
jgi:hypothetical protein